jgi:hypothetical protein
MEEWNYKVQDILIVKFFVLPEAPILYTLWLAYRKRGVRSLLLSE